MKELLKFFLAGAVALGFIGVAGAGFSPTPSTSTSLVATPAAQVTRVPVVSVITVPSVIPTYIPSRTPRPATPTPPVAQQPLSNNSYYTNVSGNEVHSPAYSDTVPVGASAQCRDGTYSFSQHRSGTCSHHGGVDTWL